MDPLRLGCLRIEGLLSVLGQEWKWKKEKRWVKGLEGEGV